MTNSHKKSESNNKIVYYYCPVRFAFFSVFLHLHERTAYVCVLHDFVRVSLSLNLYHDACIQQERKNNNKYMYTKYKRKSSYTQKKEQKKNPEWNVILDSSSTPSSLLIHNILMRDLLLQLTYTYYIHIIEYVVYMNINK